MDSGLLLGSSSCTLVGPQTVEDFKLFFLCKRSIGIDSRSLSDIEDLSCKECEDIAVGVCTALKGFGLVDAGDLIHLELLLLGAQGLSLLVVLGLGCIVCIFGSLGCLDLGIDLGDLLVEVPVG